MVSNITVADDDDDDDDNNDNDNDQQTQSRKTNPLLCGPVCAHWPKIAVYTHFTLLPNVPPQRLHVHPPHRE